MIDKVYTDSSAQPAEDPLAYVPDAYRTNEHGTKCLVLDTDKIDFSNAKHARKKATTLVIEAHGGENTAQIFANGKETQWPYTAQKGDAIFIQGDIEAGLNFMKTGEVSETHGPIDVYVPDNAKLSSTGRLQFKDLETEGFEILPPQDWDIGTMVKSPPAKILHEANQYWVCITPKKEGGQIKFFPPKSSFKLLDGQVSGINKIAFDETWEILPEPNTGVAPEKNQIPKPESCR
jgi:hypothetical protein